MAWRTYQERSMWSMLLLWLVNRIGLIVMLPRAYLTHEYHASGLLVPPARFVVVSFGAAVRFAGHYMPRQAQFLVIPVLLSGLVYVYQNNYLYLADKLDNRGVTDNEYFNDRVLFVLT
jgi:hypothetical protein